MGTGCGLLELVLAFVLVSQTTNVLATSAGPQTLIARRTLTGAEHHPRGYRDSHGADQSLTRLADYLERPQNRIYLQPEETPTEPVTNQPACNPNHTYDLDLDCICSTNRTFMNLTCLSNSVRENWDLITRAYAYDWAMKNRFACRMKCYTEIYECSTGGCPPKTYCTCDTLTLIQQLLREKDRCKACSPTLLNLLFYESTAAATGHGHGMC